ncbi:MAG: hypothetical protein IJY65_00060 [Clostridia bacterium]|nr:hypothetical protein [Clostridia bacterium]
MEDFERYGDYNDTDDDYAGGRGEPIMLILKILTGLVCALVIGVVLFRIILFNYYPDNIKNIYFNDELTEYYNAQDGNIGARTQDLRFPYDDSDLGNFFCDNLIIIDGVDQLQLSVRFNVSAMADIEERYKLENLDPDDETLLSFRLYDNYGRAYEDIVYSERDSFAMYRYYKLVFDGVVLEDTGDGKFPEWIRLEVFVGDNEEPYSYVLVYENNVDFSTFSDYALSAKEKPND